MLYLKRSGGISSAELKAELVRARVPKAKQFNVADILAKGGVYVAAEHDGKVNRWSLTETGEKFVAELLGLHASEAEVVNAADGLTALAHTVTDEVVRGYIEEALTCYQVDAKRAAVVFLWSGAIRHLQEQAFTLGVKPLNLAIQKHDTRAKPVSKFEDFSSIKDVTQLLAFRELGMIDKGE